MELSQKLEILADAAKYDAACTSSGLDRAGRPGTIGSTTLAGCCHSFSADGRVYLPFKGAHDQRVRLRLSILRQPPVQRPAPAAFTPRELCELTMGFYRRQLHRGAVLSSAVLVDPDYTTERMIEALRLLREEYRFGGYIHAKAIPGADPRLTYRLGLLADRMSVNIELPSAGSLAPAGPGQEEGRTSSPPWGRSGTASPWPAGERKLCRHAPPVRPGGPVHPDDRGGHPESDRQILTLTQGAL